MSDHSQAPSRTASLLALSMWFGACFLLLPVWALAPELPERLAWLAGLLAAGTLWVCLAAGPVILPDWKMPFMAWLGALLFTLAWHLRHLTSGIPWKGDEDYHIVATLQYLEVVRKPVFLALPAAAVFLLVLHRFRPRLALAGLWPFLVLCLYLSTKFPDDPIMLLRYPGVNRLFTVPGITLSDWLGIHPPEWLFRLAPFCATAAIAALTGRRASDSPLLVRYLLVALVVSVPVMAFYATILYLELPMVLLMAIAFFSGRELLTRSFGELRLHPAWYALILTGFLRESALPFLAAFLAARFLTRLRLAGGLPGYRWWAGEIFTAVAVLLPLVLQLALGSRFDIARSYSPNWANLFDWPIVRSVLTSYAESFGFTLVPFAAGVYIMARRRQWPILGWLFAFGGLNFAFWTADSLAFWGHSRFNLLLMPALLYPAVIAFNALGGKFPNRAALAVALVIAGNLALSPLRADGTKKDGWGVYYTDAEYYYPYREALHWLSREIPGGSLLMAGMDYDYDYRYYQTRFGGPAQIGFRPLTDLPEAALAAEEAGYDALLFQVGGEQLLSLPPDSPFGPDTVFENKAGKLLLFSRRPGTQITP